MGFEPTVRYKRTQHFQCCALNHLDHLSDYRCLEKLLSYYTTFFEKSKAFFKKNQKPALFSSLQEYSSTKSCQYYPQEGRI